MSALRVVPTSGGTERRPGDPLELTVSWSLAEPPTSLDVRLFWFTQGKGTRDVGVVESQPVDIGGARGDRRVRFRLPDSPYSFSGTLITLQWAVELIANADQVARWEFVMAPDGHEVRLEGEATSFARGR